MMEMMEPPWQVIGSWSPPSRYGLLLRRHQGPFGWRSDAPVERPSDGLPDFPSGGVRVVRSSWGFLHVLTNWAAAKWMAY